MRSWVNTIEIKSTTRRDGEDEEESDSVIDHSSKDEDGIPSTRKNTFQPLARGRTWGGPGGPPGAGEEPPDDAGGGED